MSDFAQSVKQQADIVRVIGEYITLKKSGAQNYSGLCPFHGEKTPSFSVHVTRQFYHCFGCGVSGDVFKFVQEIDKVSFPEAVKIVAQKCGIALPKREFSSPEEAAESRLRGRLLELYEQATLFFEEQLKSPEGARAREYLTGRGLKPETLAKFRIGYAPEGFGGLRDRLNGAAPPDVLRASGLFGFKAQEDGGAGRMYDYFRKRITFPIANEGGRVIAFTARALDSDDKGGPKYLNSPETPLYSKGQVLFNLDKARQAIRQQNFALLVEGQMDCISVFAAGVAPVLATSGTAFTEQQARLLRRYTTRVVVNFDPDTAGANAAEKSIALLTEEGFEVRVVTLEGGLDPDRFVRERGIQAYAEALKSAVRHSDYLIERARKLFPVRTAQGKVEAVNFLLPHIQRMPDVIAKVEFAKDIGDKLAIDAALLRERLKQAAAKRPGQVAAMGISNLSECERVLVRALAGPLGSETFRRVFQAMEAQPEHFEGLGILTALQELAGRAIADPLEVLQPSARTMVAQLLMRESEPVNGHELESTLVTLERHFLEHRQRRLRGAIAEAERRGDLPGVTARMTERMELDRRLRDLDQRMRELIGQHG
ncbi:MAG TPA: DNA primase [Acidobacteriaceae bacterium]|jgi:DNA primase|nr:DNA primase [Acidobacteriaceae bacterium]